MNSEASVKEITKSVWGASPAGSTHAKHHSKGTKEFFESVLDRRFSEECKWMDDIVNFAQFNDKNVLEIGCGAGYDAYQFCKHGAHYTGIDITPENPLLTKKHLSYYGYTPRTFEMDVEHLDLEEKFDFIFSFGVLHHTPNIKKALCTIHASLKDNGQAQIIVYNKYSIFYVFHVVLFDWILGLKFLKMSLKDRRSLIEYTTSSAKPLVNVYSKKEIHALCKEAGFEIIKTDIRKLERADLPYIRFISRLYRFIPDAWLDFLGKRFGWYVSVLLVKDHNESRKS